MPRKRLVTLIAAGLIVALIGAAVALGVGRSPAPDPDSTVASTVSTSTPSASGEDTATDPGQSPEGSPPSPTGQADDDDQQPPASPEPAAPAVEGLPAAGAELDQLTTAPERTVIAMPASRGAEGERYQVVFEPYGFGPRTLGPSIVGYILSMEPVGSAGTSFDLAGRNVVLTLGTTPIETGGRYQATVVTRLYQDQLFFVIEEVRPAEVR